MEIKGGSEGIIRAVYHSGGSPSLPFAGYLPIEGSQGPHFAVDKTAPGGAEGIFLNEERAPDKTAFNMMASYFGFCRGALRSPRSSFPQSRGKSNPVSASAGMVDAVPCESRHFLGRGLVALLDGFEPLVTYGEPGHPSMGKRGVLWVGLQIPGQWGSHGQIIPTALKGR